MKIRQPIVSVLGHVDHGKTTLLDDIRGSAVASREAGKITQHIGATEVPIETIEQICGDMLKGKKFTVPGLLFIDTPGHYSFTTLRSRGGALADLAVLVIDVMEGLKPQTIESINILKRHRTPFVVAVNKIDRMAGWRSKKKRSFFTAFSAQTEHVQSKLDERLYELIGNLYTHGFSAERYDKVSDFQKNIALVPISAKHDEGISDLLLILIGLAQRYLERELETEEGPAEGTILEVKEERGFGTTIDVIVYKGTIKKGDTVVIGTTGEPIVTKVKALLRPKPLDEIRDPREQFDSCDAVSAAAGVKISAQSLESVIAGTPLKVASEDVEGIVDEIRSEMKLEIETKDEGLIVKADAIGSLEALAFELKEKEIPIKKAEVGDVSKRDVIDCATSSDPLKRALLAFNVKVLPDARDEITRQGAIVFESSIIYKLMEDYEEWRQKRRKELEREARGEITHPGMFKVLPDCVFRMSKPAICGVRVLAGRIRPGQGILRADGRVVGRIKSIQSEGKSLKEAISGEEVAISIEGVTVGRQLCVEDILYVDIPEGDCKRLDKTELNVDEQEILDKVCEIKRKENQFWGM
ncbi:MAG: translation initiation factor IF-2 [Methanomassiliicoccales archaeon]|nr:MAG: translation initiation factor IF-2 [Methanomassiliicoccales archaeon]